MILSVALLLALSVSPVAAIGGTVPDEYEVTHLASGLNQPKGIISPLHRAGAGQFGNKLYVAESGLDQVATVDKTGAGASPFASVGDFPVGVAFSGGNYGEYLYVGNAFAGGIDRIDANGNVTAFALAGQGIAGMDFGRGAYGNYLYAGEWGVGNIWKVDPSGNASLFATVPGQTRYLKFSHGNGFGTYLYYTDFFTGDIYQVDTNGIASLFAQTSDNSLEGLAFSPGGVFGHYLYAGSIGSGNIYQVAPDGAVTLWASGFGGVADIHFEPGKKGGFTMYIVDGQYDGNVYAISKK
ncbi:hypothetical protein ACFLVX_05020 [Chloroflexota bacterium]